jgi:hypothetical protein
MRLKGNNSKQIIKFTHIQVFTCHKSFFGQLLSLVDRGANGGVAGNNVRVIFTTVCTVDVRGMDN